MKRFGHGGDGRTIERGSPWTPARASRSTDFFDTNSRPSARKEGLKPGAQPAEFA